MDFQAPEASMTAAETLEIESDAAYKTDNGDGMQIEETQTETLQGEPIAASVPETQIEAKPDPVADTKVKVDTDGANEDAQDDEDDEYDEDGDEVYVVEMILDHRGDFEDEEMRYLIKWKGWEKKSDRTWETEENLSGAREILEQYWESIGGQPDPSDPKPQKKRQKRGSSNKNASEEASSKRAKTTSRRRNERSGSTDQDQDISRSVGYTEVGDDDWRPPPPKAGNWDPMVQSIDTVVREADGDLWGFIIWFQKNDGDRHYRSKAQLAAIYEACPQRMLHFYEKHLVFNTSDDSTKADPPSSV